MVQFLTRLALLALTTATLAAAARADVGVLDFHDGNKVTGTLVSPGVFRSDRFGVIGFSPEQATFVPTQSTVTSVAEPQPPVSVAEGASPAVERKRPKGRLLENWKFSIAGFWDERSEGEIRESTYDLLFRFERPKLKADRISGTLTYNYVDKQGIIDRRRATAKGEWDHDLSARWVLLYRPEAEYDGRNLEPDIAAQLGRSRINYGLLQNQIGVGYRLIDKPTYKTTVSANWAFLNLRLFHYATLNFDVPVVSVENDFTFPWKLSLKHNARAYYLISDDQLSMTSELELKKQLTDFFYLTLRHEYRVDFISEANELNRLRLLFGIDF